MPENVAQPDGTFQPGRSSPAAAVPQTSDGTRAATAKLFFFALAVCGVANAFHLFAFPLTIDAELFAFIDRPDDFLANERWTAEVLSRLLVPRSTIPVVPDLLAIAAAAAAYTLTAITWRRTIGFEHYVAAPLALAFPLLFEVMLFPSYSYGVFIGLLLASLGVWFLGRDTLPAHAAALGCLCLAVGVYQPISVYPAVTLAVAVALEVERRGIPASLRRLLVGGTVVAVAVLLSHLIGAAIVKVGGYSSDYIGGYFRLDLLVQTPRKVLGKTAALGRAILSGTGDTFIEQCTPYVAFLALVSAWGVVAAALARDKARALVATVLVICGILGSIGVAAIDGGVLPMRTLLGVPIALAGLAFTAAADRARPPAWSSVARWSLAIGSAWCYLAFATIGNRISYSAYVTWLNDRAIGREIITRIDALPGLDLSRPIPIELSGSHDWPRSQMMPDVGSNPAGASFFGWDDGNVGRVVSFLKTLGRSDFDVASPEQHARIAASVAILPSWPRPGAVAAIDGVAVVKFGPYTAAQR